MGDEPFRCSSVSLATDEPLHGTASRYRFWLLVEQPGRWGHDALTDSDFPPEVGRALRAQLDPLGVRVLLVKQRAATPDRPRRCFAGYTGRDEHRLVGFEVEHPADLVALGLPDHVRDRFRRLGRPVESPVFLVCTHGKHDACCALLGGPLYRALEGFGGDAVWEATHVGGDRFAGNLVCMPHGLYYGRLGPAEAREVAEAYARGHIDLRFFRGRSSFPPVVQSAEHFIRERVGLTEVDDLRYRGHRHLGDRRYAVEFEDLAGRGYAADVRVRRRDPRPLTCKARDLERPRAYLLEDLRATPPLSRRS